MRNFFGNTDFERQKRSTYGQMEPDPWTGKSILLHPVPMDAGMYKEKGGSRRAEGGEGKLGRDSTYAST